MLLDTNVLSEAYTARPNEAVMAFLDTLDMGRTFTSVVVLAELRFGAAISVPGRRRSQMEDWIAGVQAAFEDRILGIDVPVAERWAAVGAAAQAAGRRVGTADGLIAATALHHGLAVATRNVRHFEPTGVAVVNPWGN